MLFGTLCPSKQKNPALTGFICSGVDAVVIWFHSKDIGFGLYADIGWNLFRFRFVCDAPAALTM